MTAPLDTFLSVAAALARADPDDLPEVLCHRCVQVTGADAAGVLLGGAPGRLRLSAVAGDVPGAGELLAGSAADGPPADVYRAGAEVAEADLGRGGRWPSFRAEALARGFAAAYGFPLDAGKQVLGTIMLLQAAGRPPLDDTDLGLVRGMAVLATIQLLHERALHDTERHAARLQAALDSRVVIEQAKGILAERLSLSLDESFQRLRSYARHRNLRLRDVARAVVEGRLEAV